MEAVFFGEWLRMRRENLGLTRPEVAQCVGCSVSALRKIEADERRPSQQLAELLARCLQIADADRRAFIRAARGNERVERLGEPAKAAATGQTGLIVSPVGWTLPAPATQLIGRKAELATLSRLVNDPACRLLTLVGPGGIGKSRLALELACNEWARFPDGAVYVPLAPVSAPEHLVQAIAQAVGCQFSGPAPPRAQLINYLRGRRMLLLLDNLEHLIRGVKLLAELLERAPGLTLLATSRERLELQGEWVFEVEGLPIPAAGQEEGIEGYSAVQLFEQCARRARLSFALTEANRPHVVRICQLLGGMPLGLELAGVWVAVLSCAEIADELARDLDILATSRRDVPERHRSLRAVFDHSWRLLNDDEQQVARALSVFRGGFRREAAAAVAGASLPMLSALVAKSFLRRSANGRYSQHELIRHYAVGRLLEHPEQEVEARERHSRYYCNLAAGLEVALKGRGQPEAKATIDADIDNIRAAMRWAVTHACLESVRRPMRAWWQYYELRGWFQEGATSFGWTASELGKATAAQGEERRAVEVLQAYAQAQQGWFCLRLGRFEEAQKLLEPSLGLLRAAGAWRELVDALQHAGALARLMGDYSRSRACFEEMLRLAQLTEDRWNATIAEGNIGLAAAAVGDYEEGQARMASTVETFRELGDDRMLAISLHFLGEVSCRLQAYEEAERYERESLELSRLTGDRWIYAMSLRILGWITLELGDGAAALTHFRACVAAAKEIAEQWSIVQGLTGLGAALMTAGDTAAARDAFREGLALAWEMQALPDVLAALLGLARCGLADVVHEAADAARQARQALLLPVLAVMEHPAASQRTRDEACSVWSQIAAQLPAVQVQTAQANAHTVPLGMIVNRMLAPPLLAGAPDGWESAAPAR